MARAQVGNEIGVTANDRADETLLAAISAEGANTFTTDAAGVRNLRVGMAVQFYTKATGASVGTRNITQINSATGVVTYDGADLATTVAEGVYLPGSWEAAAVTTVGGRDGYANLNGGFSESSGFDMAIFGSVDAMRARLTAISATTYSAAQLDLMTVNDMVYALRVNDAAGSIK